MLLLRALKFEAYGGSAARGHGERPISYDTGLGGDDCAAHVDLVSAGPAGRTRARDLQITCQDVLHRRHAALLVESQLAGSLRGTSWPSLLLLLLLLLLVFLLLLLLLLRWEKVGRIEAGEWFVLLGSQCFILTEIRW